MAYKLRWLDALRAEGARTLAEEPDTRTVLVGDFHVAPYDEDVWDMAAFDGKTHVTAPERRSEERRVGEECGCGGGGGEGKHGGLRGRVVGRHRGRPGR